MKVCLNLSTLMLLLLFVVEAQAQTISQTEQKRIDSLFMDFHDTPSVTYGIIYGDDKITKTFASDDYNCRKGQKEFFRMGGMSPHFTSYAIHQLAFENRIQLDDRISEYLGDVTGLDIGGITIMDLLTHSSGLPEYWALKFLNGIDDGVAFGKKDADELFQHSFRNLNAPGEKVATSGTGAYLLSRIVEKISGMSFSRYTRENIFIPLKMSDTYFIDEENNIAGNELVSYSKENDSYFPQIVKHVDAGAAGLVTTLDDLLIWFGMFQKGKSDVFKKMDEEIHLRNGKVAEVSNGKITNGQQYTYKMKGILKVWDYGRIGGFASSVFRFPSEDLCIVVLSKNGLGYNGYLGMGIADILLENKYEKENQSPEKKQKKKTIALNRQVSNRFSGAYFNPANYNYREIKLVDDTLRYNVPDYNESYNLLPVSKDELAIQVPSGDYSLTWDNDGYILSGGPTTHRYEKISSQPVNSGKIIGDYFNDEMKLVFSIEKGEGGKLSVLEKGKSSPMNNVGQGNFISGNSKYRFLSFDYDKEGKVNGIYVSARGYERIFFQKITAAHHN